MNLFKANLKHFLEDEIGILQLSLVGVFKEIFIEAIEQNKSIAFVGIGTQRIMFDSFGPIMGTAIRDNLNYMPKMRAYGTVHDNITALNALAKLHLIKDIEKDSLIIAIDAIAKNNYSSIGDIHVRKGAIKPAAGTNKDLGSIGDYGITLCTCVRTGDNRIDAENVIAQDDMLVSANIIMQALDEALTLAMDKYGVKRLECNNNRFYQY